MIRASRGAAWIAIGAILALFPTVAAPAPLDDAAKAFKAGDFGAAEAAYAAALKANPKDQAATLGLARIRLYQNRLDDADRLAGKLKDADNYFTAAGNVLSESLARRSALEPAEGANAIPASGTRLHFVVTDPLPIVKVRINGKADGYFAIDTTQADANIDPDFAREIGVESHEAGAGSLGPNAPVGHATLASMQIGEATAHHIEATMIRTRNFNLDGKHPLDGVLGLGVLYRFLSTIDYAHGELRLRPRADSAAFQDEITKKHATSVPMWFVRDDALFVRAAVNDGPEQLFEVNTGQTGCAIMPSKATVDDSHIVLDEMNAQDAPGAAGVQTKFVPFNATVRVGDLSRDQVGGLFTPQADPTRGFPFVSGGELAHQFFRPYALTLDFVAMKLAIER